MDVEIGEAGTGEGAEVIALWHAVGLTRPWNDPAADFALALREAGSTVLVARIDGALAGTAMVGFDGHRGWVYYLGVGHSWRGRGVARTLMAVCEQWLVARGCPKIQLMVRGDNAVALGFYDAIGYERQDVVTLGRRLDA
ncbi:GNAT family acetyltransferase [Novosphingobium sp. BL-8A]|uniref:GNAT family acetyltransferase n=1 Tax=Novosphingobium sp. BL-8A TaxID=3127639 RepID=UPI0037579C9A